jgi:hypothetical protein
VRLPADSKRAVHEIHVLTLIRMGERLASLRAWFLSSISLTTDGGSLFTLFEMYSFEISILMHASLSMGYGPHTNTVFVRFRGGQILHKFLPLSILKRFKYRNFFNEINVIATNCMTILSHGMSMWPLGSVAKPQISIFSEW